MNPENFKNSSAGKCIEVTDKNYYCFLPNKLGNSIEYYLPNEKDRLLIDKKLSDLKECLFNLKELLKKSDKYNKRIITEILNEESKYSSKIEGLNDADSISRNFKALDFGLILLNNFLPISKRIIKGIHKELTKDMIYLTPGEFRRSQVYIGGRNINNSLFVPPLSEYILDLLSDWESFYHNNKEIPDMIKIAILHYQFEAIHPFLDGNGRVGRALISLMTNELLFNSIQYMFIPISYEITTFSFQHDYYEGLIRVSKNGDWFNWINLFLTIFRCSTISLILKIENILLGSRQIGIVTGL